MFSLKKIARKGLTDIEMGPRISETMVLTKQDKWGSVFHEKGFRQPPAVPSQSCKAIEKANIVHVCIYGSGHEGADVLLAGFAIIWWQSQVTRQPTFVTWPVYFLK